MKKVVFKTALKTLLTVIIALLIAFGIASLGFPGSMASLCEKAGNYSLAAGYSSLSYTYSKDIDDLARCAEDSILSKSDGKIIKYCGKLLNHDGFDELCKRKSGDMKIGDIVIKVDYKNFITTAYDAALARSGAAQN